MIIPRSIAYDVMGRKVGAPAESKILDLPKYHNLNEEDIDPEPNHLSPNKTGPVDSSIKTARFNWYHSLCYMFQLIQVLFTNASVVGIWFMVKLNVFQYCHYPYFNKTRFFHHVFSIFHDHFKIHHDIKGQVASDVVSKRGRKGKIHDPRKWKEKHQKSNSPPTMLWKCWTWVVSTKWLFAFLIIHHNRNLTCDPGEHSVAMNIIMTL
jgi:hypothetical protein